MPSRCFQCMVLASVCIGLVGCSTEGDGIGDERERMPTPVQEQRPPREFSDPSIEYVSVQPDSGDTDAVVVAGHPLLHTRQLLPLDADGNMVGDDAVEQQIERVLANLEVVLDTAGSGYDKLIRLNIYADSPETADQVRAHVESRVPGDSIPVITAVETPLPAEGARVAVDAVALAAAYDDGVALLQSQRVNRDKKLADGAIMPRGGAVYLSGYPDREPLPQGASNSLDTLLDIVDQLELDPSHVAHLRVFMQSATAADQVLRAVKKHFPRQLAPPVSFVQWRASAPVEIEMVVHLPLSKTAPADPVRYYTPPQMDPSPKFSRVAVVDTDRQIYIAGLSAREPGDGEFQLRDIFEQLEAILSKTGSDLLHLAKATYYVSGDDANQMLGELRPEYYDPQRPPAASLARVHGVAQPKRTLRIDMIATGK